MFVQDTLCGIYYAHQDEVAFTDGSRKAMVKKQRKPGKVALCTGGGSGHLPLFLGYIGQGMLDGCSVGEVFASPSVNDMLSVTKAVDNGAGVLYLYGNYGGDKMKMEIGMGIHGEPGIRRGKIMTAEEITNELLAKILPELDLKAGDDIYLL